MIALSVIVWLAIGLMCTLYVERNSLIGPPCGLLIVGAVLGPFMLLAL